MEKIFRLQGNIEKFPGKAGWTYISVPKSVMQKVLQEKNTKVHYGLVPIVATVGKTSWKTSLLPKGDGTKFIALNKTIIKKENLALEDTLLLTFILRAGWNT